MTDPQGDIDFFISYRGRNTAWAKWIKWVVRGAGYTTISMDEFPKGTEFTERMRDACEHCRRLLSLYSADYWDSGACTAEFDTYWHHHFGNKTARFIVPLEIEGCTVPDAHRQLLFATLHTLNRADAIAAIRAAIAGIPATGTAITEPEPPFPVIASTPATVIDWPEKVEELKWPLADHDEARLAFAELVTRSASFRLLAIKGNSETGKSHLTTQFITNAQRRVTACRCARFDFKGTDQIDQTLADFVQHLEVPMPPPASALSDRFRHILQSLGQRQQPSLIVFDTYEDAGDTDRWVRESLLTSLHRHPWLRVVIAGQEVPACHGSAWAEDSRLLRLDAPHPDHWMEYAKASGRTITSTTLEEVHRLTGGKASILAQLCGPNT
jgi:TIR domain